MSDDAITQNDLQQMEEHLLQSLDRKFEALDRKIEAVDARIEKLETTLLAEFHQWASPMESRVRTHRSWSYEVDAEVEALKDRLRKLEDRPNA